MTKKYFIQNFDSIIYEIENPEMSNYDEYLNILYNLYSPKQKIKERFQSEKWIKDEDVVLLIKLKNKEYLFEGVI
jgi:hypothetical protein